MTTADRVIVIGTSAGGLAALSEMLPGLPRSLQAAVCIVVHRADNGTDALSKVIGRSSSLPVVSAQDGETLQSGQVYVAPAGHHLLCDDRRIRVSSGPTEHGFRPAIDPLFRTAAASFGSAATAVVLSGSLDDGSAGAAAVWRAGGAVVVQDPATAHYPDMPRNAIAAVGRDRVEVAPAEQMPALLEAIVARPVNTSTMHPGDNPGEHEPLRSSGEPEFVRPATLSCPSCHGPLHEDDDGMLRCLVGHGWSLESLASGQMSALENGLWQAIRILEERASLVVRLRERALRAGHDRAVERYRRQLEDAESQAAALREFVVATRTVTAPPLTEPATEPSLTARPGAETLEQPAAEVRGSDD